MITAKNIATAKIDFAKLPAKFKDNYGDIKEMAEYHGQDPEITEAVDAYVAALNAELGKAKPKAPAKKKATAKRKPAAKKKATAKKSSSKRTQSNAEAAKAKKAYEADKRKAEAGEFAKLSRKEVLAIAQRVHRNRRLSAQIVDERADHKKRLTPTPENLVRWMKEPGKFDLIGVDNFKENDPTSDLKIRKEIFWHRLLKK
jgi:hypothetical protein